MTPPRDAGTYAVNATINSLNYTGSATGTLTISKAVPVITWNAPAPIVYGAPLDGTQLNATANLIGGGFVYTPAASVTPLSAGVHTLSVTYTPADTNNYTTATASVPLTVLEATATITLSGLSTTYDGTSKSIGISTSPNGLATSVLYNGAAALPIGAGSYSVLVTVNDPNYSGTSSGVFFIAKATPVITWAPTVTSIAYGTGLDGGQLNASAGLIPGSFTYTPASGAILSGGLQTLSTVFTPTDGADYNTATATTMITVNPATTVTVALANLNAVYDGSSKSVSVTTTPSGLAVDVTYTDSANVTSSTPPTNAGTYAVNATINSLNYTGSATGTLTISKAVPVITWNVPAPIVYGAPLDGTQLNATANLIGGGFVYTPAHR